MQINPTINELFNESFMSQYTSFNSWDEFIEKGNFNKDISQNSLVKFNEFIANNTQFSNWIEFQKAAGEYYLHSLVSKRW